MVDDKPFEGVEPSEFQQAYGYGKLRKLRRKLNRRMKLRAKAEEEEAAKAKRRAAHQAANPANAAKRVSKQPLKLIIAGAPASGKGTQCAIIKEKYGVVHLSTGDMLRAAVAAGTEVGRKAKDFMDSGMLVPDDVIIGVVSTSQTADVMVEPELTTKPIGDRTACRTGLSISGLATRRIPSNAGTGRSDD